LGDEVERRTKASGQSGNHYLEPAEKDSRVEDGRFGSYRIRSSSDDSILLERIRSQKTPKRL